MENRGEKKSPSDKSRRRLAVIIVIVALLHIVFIGWMERTKVKKTASEALRTNVEVDGKRVGKSEGSLAEKGARLMKEGKFDEALKLFDRILEKDPWNKEALEGKSNALMSMERWEAAMPVVETLLKADPENVDALLNRSRIYLERGDMENYVKDRRTAQKIRPHMVRTNIELGRALSWVGRGQEALVYFEKAHKLSPTAPEKAAILTSEAYAYKMMKNPAKAEKLLLESLKLKVSQCDNEVQCYFMLAGIYIDMNRDEDALKMIDQYKKMDPNFRLSRYMGREIIATHFRNMGSLYLYKNRFDESLECYSRSLEMEPDNRQGLLERAFVYFLTGRKKEALKDAENWRRTNPPPPSDSDEYECYAVAHVILGDGVKALDYMNRALKAEPDNYRLYGTRALIYHHLKKEELFRKDLDAFLEKADGFEKETVRILLKRAGQDRI